MKLKDYFVLLFQWLHLEHTFNPEMSREVARVTSCYQMLLPLKMLVYIETGHES